MLVFKFQVTFLSLYWPRFLIVFVAGFSPLLVLPPGSCAVPMSVSSQWDYGGGVFTLPAFSMHTCHQFNFNITLILNVYGFRFVHLLWFVEIKSQNTHLQLSSNRFWVLSWKRELPASRHPSSPAGAASRTSWSGGLLWDSSTSEPPVDTICYIQLINESLVPGQHYPGISWSSGCLETQYLAKTFN